MDSFPHHNTRLTGSTRGLGSGVRMDRKLDIPPPGRLLPGRPGCSARSLQPREWLGQWLQHVADKYLVSFTLHADTPTCHVIPLE